MEVETFLCIQTLVYEILFITKVRIYRENTVICELNLTSFDPQHALFRILDHT